MQLYALGTVDLRGEGGRLVDSLSQSKPLALLAYLLLAKPYGFHRRDKLVGIFWPDHSTRSGRAALSRALYRLRVALGVQAIDSLGDEAVAIDRGRVACDALQFETFHEQQCWRAALDLYGGDLLAGLHVSSASAEFDYWLESRRSELREQAADAAWKLVQTAQSEARPDDAFRYARRYLALRPGEEMGLRNVLRLLGPSAEKAAVLSLYQEFCGRLAAEFELEPSPEIAALLDEIVRRPVTAAETLAAPVDSASVAVLPFFDLSPQRDQEYFSDGLADELLNVLSKVDGLRVVARTSSFAFKGKNTDAGTIGRQLRVAHLLTGSIRTNGTRLRVTVQLVDSRNESQLWSEKYDGELSDVFRVQENIASAVVRTLQPRLVVQKPASTTTTQSVVAYQAYLRGRFQWYQKSHAALLQALTSFSTAIREDPTFAPAYAGLADTYLSLIDGDVARTDESARLQRAESAALRALQLEPQLAEGYASLGHASIHRFRWTDAEQQFRQATALNSNYAVAHQYYAILLTLVGRFDEGIGVIRRAQQLDPLSLATHGSAGYLLYLARRFAEAEQQLREVIAIDPRRDGPHMRLGMVLLAEQRYEEALAHLQEANQLRKPSPAAWPLISLALLRAGRLADARAALQEVDRLYTAGGVSLVYSASLFGAFGDFDRAFAIFNEMADSNHSALVDVIVDPVHDHLRGDPRFAALARRIGLDATIIETARDFHG